MVTWQEQATWKWDEKLRQEATSLIHPVFPPRPNSMRPFFVFQKNQECQTPVIWRLDKYYRGVFVLLLHEFYLRFSR